MRSRRLRQSLLVAVLFSLPLGIAADEPAFESDDAEAIIVAMNVERAAEGLEPLHWNRELSEAANDRVRDMFEQGYFAHVAPDGTSPFVWIDRHGYSYHDAGENLAVGYGGQEVVDGWMHSPGHRANILGRNFSDVGIAIAQGSPDRKHRGPLIVALYGGRYGNPAARLSSVEGERDHARHTERSQ